MANVPVIQRHAHLAGAVKLEFVNGREGKIAKAVLTAISNTRRGSGETREEESTAIQWTLWGKQAENAAEYLGKGSHVNIVGRLRNNNYEKDGETVYGMAFTAEEIDYLDSRAESEARRTRGDDDDGAPSARNGSGEQAAPAATHPQAPQRAPAGARRRLNPHRVGVMPTSRARPSNLTQRSKETIMYSTPTLATRFARNTRVMRGDQPLSEDQMRAAAPSIFAEGKHASRSERYTYIPTIDVLRGLRKEGFEPFMVAQGASRVEGKAEFTKHMIRMRHRERPGADPARGERDHPDQQPRRRQQLPDARGHVPLRLLQRPGGGRGGGGHPHPAQGQHPGRGDRRRVPRA